MNTQAETAARLEKLRGYLARDPKNVLLLSQSADLALSLGQAKDAQGLIERALAVRPQDGSLLAQLASAKLALGETQAALELLEPLFKADGEAPILRFNYGYALLRAERYAEARDVLATLAAHPEAPSSTRLLLARALHSLGEVDEAIEHARAYADEHPEDAAAAGALSLLYIDASNWEEARRWSERALKDRPENLDALLAAGTAALAAENDGEAQQVFEKALRVRPGNGRAWAGLGSAALMKFDVATARKHMERAAQHMPGHVETLNVLAWCQMLDKDYAAARATLERSLEVDRNFGETHGALAMLAVFRGNWGEAEHHAQRARGLNPDSYGGRMVPILKLQSAGQIEAARQQLQEGLRSFSVPGGGTLADMMGRIVARKHGQRPRPK